LNIGTQVVSNQGIKCPGELGNLCGGTPPILGIGKVDRNNAGEAQRCYCGRHKSTLQMIGLPGSSHKVEINRAQIHQVIVVAGFAGAGRTHIYKM